MVTPQHHGPADRPQHLVPPASQTEGATPLGPVASPQFPPGGLPSAVPHPTASAIRSPDDVNAEMIKRGFPELEMLWRGVERSKRDPSQLDPERLARDREQHTQPLVGMPALALTAVGAVASAGTWMVAATMPSFGLSSLPIGKAIQIGLIWSNLAVFGVWALGQLQGRVFSPAKKIMAREVGFMLTRQSFRGWFSSTARARSFAGRAAGVGISASWDDPSYGTGYSKASGEWQRVAFRGPTERVHDCLQSFLGKLERQVHRPGRFMMDLINRKRSVTDFIKAHRADIELSKVGKLPVESGIALLTSLRDSFVRPDSAGCRTLTDEINALQKPHAAPPRTVVARVWARDPWVDLTHQEEFYSSASLRGKKLVGRGIAGRLGTFGYLYNPSIVALDFSHSGGRAVRARLGAALVTTTDKQRVPVLFVDGVEGSNAVNPEVIKLGIEDYARACGFHAVVYGTRSLNQTPKRFVDFVRSQGAELKRMQLEYLDAATREYLDSFGLPLGSLEYRSPRGIVVGYIVPIKSSTPIALDPPRWLDHARAWFRRNLLTVIVVNSMAFGAWSAAQLHPLAGVGVVLFVAVGIGFDRWFQRRSQRSRPSESA